MRVVVMRADGPSFSAGLDRAMLTPGGAPGELSILALSGGAVGPLEQAIEQFQAGRLPSNATRPIKVAPAR